MSTSKKVSVIMSVYNTKEEWLRESIESILNQTFTDFEFIIINDGSTNNAEEVILSYKDKRIKYMKQLNQGQAIARNRALDIAVGEYIAIMDSDDISYPERFEKQVDYLDKNKNISVLGSWFEKFPQQKIYRLHEIVKYLNMLKGCCIGHPTVMWRRVDFEKYGLRYNPEYKCEDYELWSRAIKYVKFANLQEVLLKYRWHGNNSSKPTADFISYDKKVKQNMLNFLTDDKNLQKYLKSKLFPPRKLEYSFWELIFSIKNSLDKKHKVITILGIKIRFKKGKFLQKLYELNYKNLRIPKVTSREETLDILINTNKSISRFGEGEFKIIMGQDIEFQKFTTRLKKRLIEILFSQDDNILIAIPNVFGTMKNTNAFALKFWRKYLINNRKKIYKYLNFDKLYCDALVTRPYIDLTDRSMCGTYFKRFKKLWDNKDIVFVEGYASRLGYGNDLFDNAKSIRRIICPEVSAFDKYEEILSACKELPKDTFFMLALGPTATVLSYDLAKLNYRAIDIGHIDIEYEWFLQGATKKVGIKNKYVNEARDDNIYEDITDEVYLKQIIKSIKS